MDAKEPTADELERQAIRLETACSIIQEVHHSLSLQDVIEGIVQNLVVPGGFAGAEIAIEAQVGNLELRHHAKAGKIGASEALTHGRPVFIRGLQIGALTTYFHSDEDIEGKLELLEF